MRSRPWVLFLMAGFYLAVAVSFPLQLMVAYEHSWSELPEAFAKLTFINWLVIGALATGSILFYRGSTKMILAAIAVSVLIFVNNVVVGTFGEDFSLLQTLLASVMFAGLHFPLRNSDVQKLIKQPELRWWRTAYRQKLRIPITLRTKNYHHLVLETYDISDSGLFIKVPAQVLNTLKALKLDEIIQITLKFDSLNQIRCNARISRIAGATGNYPSGIGIEFTDLSAKDRKRIHRFRAKNLGPETASAVQATFN